MTVRLKGKLDPCWSTAPGTTYSPCSVTRDGVRRGTPHCSEEELVACASQCRFLCRGNVPWPGTSQYAPRNDRFTTPWCVVVAGDGHLPLGSLPLQQQSSRVSTRLVKSCPGKAVQRRRVWCVVVVWCDGVWRAEGAVTKRPWLGWSCTRDNASREGCVPKRAPWVCVCCAPVTEGRPSLLAPGGCCPGLPWGPLPLCLDGATGVPTAHAPPGSGRAVLRPAHGRLRTSSNTATATLRWAVCQKVA